MKPELSTYEKDIESCLSGSRFGISQNKARELAYVLKFCIETALSKIELNDPSYEDSQTMAKLINGLLLNLSQINKASKRSKYVETALYKAGLFCGLSISLIDITKFFEMLNKIVIQDSKKFRPGKSNPFAHEICEIICRVYETQLGRKPTVNGQCTIKQTGDLSAATAYERICYFVEKHLLSSTDIRLTHYAKKKAVGNYYKPTDITGLFGPQLVQKRKK